MSSSTAPCSTPCPIGRARFLRSLALTALAGIGASALMTDSAFAQSMGSISPAQSRGRTFTYPIPSKDGAFFDEGNGIIIARANKAVYAMSIACPHRSLTTLEWMPGANEFHCPKHDAHFRRDGELIDGRPDRGIDRFAVRRSGSNLIVDASSLLQQDVSETAWTHAVVNV